MKLREKVTLSDLGQPALGVLSKLPRDYGFEVSGLSLISDREYDPAFVGELRRHLDGMSVSGSVRQFVYPVFSHEDLRSAPLLELILPEVWIDEVAFARTCEACGSKRVRVDYSTVVKTVPHEADVLDVNGQCVVFSRRAREAALDASVSGAEYAPFDADGRYFYVRPRLDLGMPIIKPDEVLERRSDCPTCGAPLFRAFFGPLRFQAHRWSGEDLVRTSAVDETLFSQRAFEFLRGLDSSVERDRPVLLE